MTHNPQLQPFDLTRHRVVTSVVVMAPLEVQAVVAPIMQQFALENLINLPAHITVLYPFAPPDKLESTYPDVQKLCKNIQPFDVTLEGYGRFPKFIYMKLKDGDPIRTIFRQFQKNFPEYRPYDGLYGDDLLPHITIAEFESEAEQATAELPDYPPITFRVSQVHITIGVLGLAMPALTHRIFQLGE